jgi:hypothetical protein
MQRSDEFGGGLVRAEVGKLLRLRGRRLVGPGRLRAPAIRGALVVRRTTFVLLVLVAVAGAQARGAVAQPGPDPHPSATKSPQAPKPDPAPDTAPTRTAPSRVSPDTAAPATPSSSSSSSTQPQVTTQTSPPVFRPPTRTQSFTSTAEQKTRATRPGRRPEPVAAAGKQDRQRVPLVAAVTDPANGRKLLLGGLGLLALALASGSMLFFMSRAGALEART